MYRDLSCLCIIRLQFILQVFVDELEVSLTTVHPARVVFVSGTLSMVFGNSEWVTYHVLS